MSKNKKTASSKKMVLNSAPKAISVTPKKINPKKVELITNKINQMNQKFENLIKDCQAALKGLSEVELTPTSN
jgi:hypothetical protein